MRGKLVRIVAWSLVGACTLLLLALAVMVRTRPVAAPPQLDAVGQPVDPGTTLSGAPAPSFTLTDQFGRVQTLAGFRGRPVVLAFIDSTCTTICPLTAQMLVDAKAQLGRPGANVQLVAVNADPGANSTADVLAWSQRHGMTHKWTFLTGPASELEHLYREYHISVHSTGGDTVTHTAAVYVLDAQGRERYLFTTDPNFSGTVPESTNLARRLATLLPGHPDVIPLPTSSGPASTAFSLRALLPGGKAGQVRAGTAAAGTELVDFFATWCAACREDLRILAQYSAQAAAKGLPPVIGVDLRVAEPSTQWVRAFLEKAHVPFPVGLDQSGRVMDAYKVTELPFLALVGPQGSILWQHTGVLPLRELTTAVATSVHH